jgi:Overcoming lysogenization defect protein-like, TOPRIM domain
MQLRGAVLVEGTSDRRAVEALARRRGRDLGAEGVAVVPMGGYGNLPRLLEQYRHVRLAGLYDVGAEGHFLRALGCDDRAELERAGFYACMRDLEDELTRAVGPDEMTRVLADHGDLSAFQTYRKQPAHRSRSLEEQLHGFMWNRKQKYAVLLVEAFDLGRVPRPLDRVLTHLQLGPRERGGRWSNGTAAQALPPRGRTPTFARPGRA